MARGGGGSLARLQTRAARHKKEKEFDAAVAE